MSADYEDERIITDEWAGDDPFDYKGPVYLFSCPDPECSGAALSKFRAGMMILSDGRPDQIGELLGPACPECDKLMKSLGAEV